MTRQIICLKCAEARTPGNYPGEWWKRVRGKARGFHNGNFVCDLCNEDIPKGTECVAQSFGRDSQPYEPWEFDFLGDEPGRNHQGDRRRNRGSDRASPKEVSS